MNPEKKPESHPKPITEDQDLEILSLVAYSERLVASILNCPRPHEDDPTINDLNIDLLESINAWTSSSILAVVGLRPPGKDE